MIGRKNKRYLDINLSIAYSSFNERRSISTDNMLSLKIKYRQKWYKKGKKEVIVPACLLCNYVLKNSPVIVQKIETL